MVVATLVGYAATDVLSATCDEGTSTPPFLGVETVPPNLMLMIDNSGSMYDLNYMENIGYCFDDSYLNDSTYAGYFMTIREIIDNAEIWYTYSTADKEYVRTTEAAKTADCLAAVGTKYQAADAAGNEFLCASIDEVDPADPSTHVPTYFSATGKFLNWLVTSKMDIQKEVLTGGKWAKHPVNGTAQLVPESRGCLDKRLIKEVSVNGGAAKLTFAIRNDDGDTIAGDGIGVDDDGNANNTVIDFHAATVGGFNNTACQQVLAALQSPTGVGGVKTPLKECLGGFDENKTPEGDMISAFNLSIQDCWYMAKFGEEEWRKTFSSAAIRNQCDTLYEGNGFYVGRDPWLLPTDVSALVCRGDYANAIEYNFVGRCYIPAGHPPAGFPSNEDGLAEEYLIADISTETDAVSGAGILPPWNQAEEVLPASQEAKNTDSFLGLAEEEPENSIYPVSEEPLAAIPAVDLSKERNTLAEAVKEFIRSGGRNEQARQKVIKAFYDFFVAEASAAGAIAEELEAVCTTVAGGAWTGTSGASGGTSVYSEVIGDTCVFPTEGKTFPHGLYEVSVIAPCEGAGGLRDPATEVTVNHVGGSSSFIHDQKDSCDVWVKLAGPEENGTFEFLADGSGNVVFTSNSNKKSYADAVQFSIYKEILPPPPPPAAGAHPYVIQIAPITVSPTDAETVSFEVVFSEDVNNFNDAADVRVWMNQTTPDPFTYTGVTITPDDTEPKRIYQVDITGISGTGEIELEVNSWVHWWFESSMGGGTFDELNYFHIPVPNPAPGFYDLIVGDTMMTPGTEDQAYMSVWHADVGLGLWGPEQKRSGFIQAPADLTCCDGTLPDTCCLSTDYPLSWPDYSVYYDGAGFSDGGTGVDWQVGDAIIVDIFPGSDVTSDGGKIVAFTERSPFIVRVEPIPETCVGAPPAGPTWWCDACIEEAIIDFCGFLSTPDVPDPSDQSSIASTGEYWNIPALLWDGAINGQLDDKIGSMSAKMKIDFVPRGLIHKYANQIRFGVMGFHPVPGGGEKSECGDYDLFTNCAFDGAKVAVPVDDAGGGHTAAVVSAINAYDGETWTPLAESMYTAVGYYTQTGSMRLDSGDYDVNADAATDPMFTGTTWTAGNAVPYAAGEIVIHNGVYYETPGGGTSHPDATSPLDDEDIVDWEIVNDPILAYCQRNFVLVITEGSSTADLNPTVASFAAANTPDADVDTEGCDVLRGSTYFDDLVGYAWNDGNANEIYEYEQFAEDKNHVEVHIVETRGPKTGTGECDPSVLLANAATNSNRVDKNGDGITGANETSLYTASNPRELWNAIDQVMKNIITQTSSGSAASVISASRSGEGALYQALFWPATPSELPLPHPTYVDWLGEVHGFFVDGSGNLREDTDQDGLLEDTDDIVVVYWDENEEKTKACNGTVADGVCTPFDPADTSKELSAVKYLWSSTDWLSNPVMDANIQFNRTVDATTGEFNFDPNTPKRYIFTWNDLDNDGAVDETTGADNEILQFQQFFDDVSPLTAPFPPLPAGVTDRGPLHVDFGIHPDGEYDANSNGIFDPCEDVNRNGILEDAEDLDADGVLDVGEDTDCDGIDDNWEGVANNIIDWVRGMPVYGMRKRDLLYDFDKNPATAKQQITWRLGDVVHSTPLSVASPAENYHQLYRDFSYAEFLVHYQDRRHVVYFGANDGMLHAMNGGFFKEYDDPANPNEKIHRFCRTQACQLDGAGNETGADLATAPLLGAELWAYVPYNLMPHLQCMTELVYDHKYFVDLRPRIFDVQIFNDDADHINGWGTILVGGMRFGGSKVRPGGYDEDGSLQTDYDNDSSPDYFDNREFTSAYFIFDITNPEKPPKLLGEFTRTFEDTDSDGIIEVTTDASPEVELGYSTNISTMVPIRINEDFNDDGAFDNDGSPGNGEDQNCNGEFDVFSKWYLILGSGPTELDGTSTQQGNVSVIPLDRFVDTDGAGTDEVLNMRIPADVPFSATAVPAGKVAADAEFGSFDLPDAKSFTSDLITVDMETNQDYMADVVYFGSNSGDWATGWGGSLYRMVVRDWQECNSRLIQVESKPSGWSGLYEPNTTPFMPLIDVDQPITTSATVGTDGVDFWVYFGTGRFFDPEDKVNVFSNSTQSFYGIREPVSLVPDDLFFLGTQPTNPPPCQLSWSQVLNDRLGTPTGGLQSDGVSALTGRGGLGIMGVHDIGILSSEYIDQPGTLFCPEAGVDDPLTPAVDESESDPLYCLPAALKVKLDNDGNPMTDPDTGDNYTGSYKDLIMHMTGDYINCAGTEQGYDGGTGIFRIKGSVTSARHLCWAAC
jgi:hypothetical protein